MTLQIDDNASITAQLKTMFMKIDQDNEIFTKQTIDAILAEDGGGTDVTDVEDAQQLAGEPGWQWGDSADANANGYVVGKDNVAVGASSGAFVFTTNDFSTKQVQAATGGATVSKLQESTNAAILRNK